MIIRIMGEGQVRIADEHFDDLQELDETLENAVDGGHEEAFRTALHALLAKIREVGQPIPDDELVHSDLFLPAGDATLAEVKSMLGDEGLIPS